MNDTNEMPKIEDTATNHPVDGKFNPAALTLSQDFHKTGGVKKVLVTVPVRKPGRQDFVRVHPDDDYKLETAVIELREEREIYLVDKELWPALSSEITPKVLYMYMNRQGVLAIWPIRMPGEDGRIDQWNGSASQAAEKAKSQWIRVSADMSLGAYQVYRAEGIPQEPDWPDTSFEDILATAFSGHYIDTLDHPVIRRLHGKI